MFVRGQAASPVWLAWPASRMDRWMRMVLLIRVTRIAGLVAAQREIVRGVTWKWSATSFLVSHSWWGEIDIRGSMGAWGARGDDSPAYAEGCPHGGWGLTVP